MWHATRKVSLSQCSDCYECFQGKVEMELEILTEEAATAKPAGVARDEPNQNPTLEPPKYCSLFLRSSCDTLCWCYKQECSGRECRDT